MFSIACTRRLHKKNAHGDKALSANTESSSFRSGGRLGAGELGEPLVRDVLEGAGVQEVDRLTPAEVRNHP